MLVLCVRRASMLVAVALCCRPRRAVAVAAIAAFRRRDNAGRHCFLYGCRRRRRALFACGALSSHCRVAFFAVIEVVALWCAICCRCRRALLVAAVVTLVPFSDVERCRRAIVQLAPSASAERRYQRRLGRPSPSSRRHREELSHARRRPLLLRAVRHTPLLPIVIT
jgi:hypothetical protein